MMAGVVTRIQNLGVEVVHIPGGCTSLCQPVDIGVNKPFKNRLRSEQWQTWMINEDLQHGTTSAPTRALIIQWCHFAMNDLPAQMVRNAWRHAEYSWFLLPTPAAGDNDDTESDGESVNNVADKADKELDDDEEELEESIFVNFSANSSVNEAIDMLPFTRNKKEGEDNESSSHLFSSSESDDVSVPPLPSTHDFVAALKSNASNQESGNEDSQLTTLSV